MSKAEIVLPVVQLALLQRLGGRLKELRRARRIGTVDLAERLSISRNTLRAVEAGAPGVAIGTYLQVVAALGADAELEALFCKPPFSESALSTERPQANAVRQVVPSKALAPLDVTRHRIQDFQSLVLHQEAVRRAKADQALVSQALTVVERWLRAGDSRTTDLWLAWRDILIAKDWKRVLARTQRAQQLRQASPLVTTLPPEIRLSILAEVAQIKSQTERGPD